VALTARLEAAPFQNKIKTGVFQQTVKPNAFAAFCGAAEAAPFQSEDKTIVFGDSLSDNIFDQSHFVANEARQQKFSTNLGLAGTSKTLPDFGMLQQE